MTNDVLERFHAKEIPLTKLFPPPLERPSPGGTSEQGSYEKRGPVGQKRGLLSFDLGQKDKNLLQSSKIGTRFSTARSSKLKNGGRSLADGGEKMRDCEIPTHGHMMVTTPEEIAAPWAEESAGPRLKGIMKVFTGIRAR